MGNQTSRPDKIKYLSKKDQIRIRQAVVEKDIRKAMNVYSEKDGKKNDYQPPLIYFAVECYKTWPFFFNSVYKTVDFKLCDDPDNGPFNSDIRDMMVKNIPRDALIRFFIETVCKDEIVNSDIVYRIDTVPTMFLSIWRNIEIEVYKTQPITVLKEISKRGWILLYNYDGSVCGALAHICSQAPDRFDVLYEMVPDMLRRWLSEKIAVVSVDLKRKYCDYFKIDPIDVVLMLNNGVDKLRFLQTYEIDEYTDHTVRLFTRNNRVLIYHYEDTVLEILKSKFSTKDFYKFILVIFDRYHLRFKTGKLLTVDKVFYYHIVNNYLPPECYMKSIIDYLTDYVVYYKAGIHRERTRQAPQIQHFDVTVSIRKYIEDSDRKDRITKRILDSDILHLACKSMNINLIHFLITEWPSLISTRDKNQVLPVDYLDPHSSDLRLREALTPAGAPSTCDAPPAYNA